jgi:hypothetical protein
MTARKPLVNVSGAVTELPTGDTVSGAGDVTGPASSTASNLAMFSGTTGKVIADSSRNASTIVSNSLAVGTDNHLARFDGAGGVFVQDGTAVTLDDSSNLTGLANVTATRFTGPSTGLRETTGPTDLTWGGIATQQYLKRSGTTVIGVDFLRAVRTTDLAAISAATSVLSLNLQAGGRIYLFELNVALVNSNTTTRTTTVAMSFTPGATAMAGNITLQPPTASTNGVATLSKTIISLATATITSAAQILVNEWYCFMVGTITPTSAGTLNINVSTSAQTVTAKAGSYLKCDEA